MNKEVLHLRNVLPLNTESQNTSLCITLQEKKEKKILPEMCHFFAAVYFVCL